jgi:hypothetical protein
MRKQIESWYLSQNLGICLLVLLETLHVMFEVCHFFRSIGQQPLRLAKVLLLGLDGFLDRNQLVESRLVCFTGGNDRDLRSIGLPNSSHGEGRHGGLGLLNGRRGSLGVDTQRRGRGAHCHDYYEGQKEGLERKKEETRCRVERGAKTDS